MFFSPSVSETLFLSAKKALLRVPCFWLRELVLHMDIVKEPWLHVNGTGGHPYYLKIIINLSLIYSHLRCLREPHYVLVISSRTYVVTLFWKPVLFPGFLWNKKRASDQ
jgi:hypothetical protein